MNHNQVYLAGHIAGDIRVREAAGSSVANCILAVQRFRSDQSDFIAIEAWGQTANRLADTCRKGTNIFLAGTLRQNRWTDKDGRTKSELRVRMQDFVVKEKGRTRRPRNEEDDYNPLDDIDITNW